jgi:hypothetical protein
MEPLGTDVHVTPDRPGCQGNSTRGATTHSPIGRPGRVRDYNSNLAAETLGLIEAGKGTGPLTDDE